MMHQIIQVHAIIFDQEEDFLRRTVGFPVMAVCIIGI